MNVFDYEGFEISPIEAYAIFGRDAVPVFYSSSFAIHDFVTALHNDGLADKIIQAQVIVPERKEDYIYFLNDANGLLYRVHNSSWKKDWWSPSHKCWYPCTGSAKVLWDNVHLGRVVGLEDAEGATVFQ